MPISAIREELKIAQNMFHRWQQDLFENAHPSFETDRTSKAIEASKDRKIEQLESKLQRNNEVLAELMQEHVPLKKRTWRALSNRWVPHATRDQVIDFGRRWCGKSEIPTCRMLRWVGIGAGNLHDWKLRFGKGNGHRFHALVPLPGSRCATIKLEPVRRPKGKECRFE